LDGLGTARITAAQAARVEPYRTALKPQGTNPPILFNLRDDPGETIDLSERFPDKVEALGARAKALMAEIKAAGILPISTPDPKDKPAGTGPGK
jgi:hypothetical protein